jgi:ribosome-associated heat shock protein Hsp15
MRIDRLLCTLRFVRTRSLGAKLASQGHLRRNGARVTKASQEIAVGDVLTIPQGQGVRLIEVLALPDKRGPAREAQACYRVLDQRGESDIGEGAMNNRPGEAGP